MSHSRSRGSCRAPRLGVAWHIRGDGASIPRRSVTLLPLLPLLCAFLSACGSGIPSTSVFVPASVAVLLRSTSLHVGQATQATATLRDTKGDVLTGLPIAWASSDSRVATVSSSGIVSAVAPGAATITATSENRSGASAVTVTSGSVNANPSVCQQWTGPSLPLSGVLTALYDNTTLAPNTKVDATAATWISSQVHVLVFVGGDSSVCWNGGQISGQLSPSTPYPTMHDTYGMDAHSPGFLLSNVRIFDTGDGVTMDQQNDPDWVWHDVYFHYMRDDCIENDFLNSGTIENSFFDGCYSGFSARAYTGVLDGSTNVVTVRNSLFRMQKMDQGYLYQGVHGGFWKWGTNSPMIDLFNVVFYMDTNSVENDVTMPPPDKLRNCSGNVMIWEGPGAFPEPVPSCFTLMTGAAGQQYWDNAVAQWKAAHPITQSDVTPPIVALWQPRTSTTLTGVVRLIATAVDDQAMAGVQFQLDGQPIGAEVTSEVEPARWALSWDSHGAPNGTHTLTAVARDAAGHTTLSAGVTVTISN